MKKLSLLVVALVFVAALTGCGKKKAEETKAPEAPVTSMPTEPARPSTPTPAPEAPKPATTPAPVMPAK
ncbi:MAG: hypothetical protein M1549_03200 [Candidatus Dependentiae bacterium]|nr:hypothetical protein [Candidatus Dependentiae bacterium]